MKYSCWHLGVKADLSKCLQQLFDIWLYTIHIKYNDLTLVSTIWFKKQNRSTEGCSKLKRSVDMTRSGKNGLNIRKNASPKWDRTRSKRPLFASRTRCNVLWKHPNFVIRSKSVIKSSSVISSQIGVMSYQLRVSLYMVMSQNVMYHLEEGDFIMFDEISISTIQLPEGRFQTFHDISQPEELRWKSRRP